jgi:hypothetical protein
MESWVGSRASLEGAENLAHHQDSTRQTDQPTASHYTHYAILAPIFIIDCVINVLIIAGGHLKHRSTQVVKMKTDPKSMSTHNQLTRLYSL